MNGTAKSRARREKPRPVFWGIADRGLGLCAQAGSGAQQPSNGDSVSERLKRPRPSAPRKEMAPGGLTGANAGRWMGVRGMGLLGPRIQLSQYEDNP